MDELDAIISTTVEISYADHNEIFKEQLPRIGIATRRIHTDNVDDWYLVELNQQVDWENLQYKYLLIRSRWLGYKINVIEKINVFILLVPDSNLPSDNNHINPHDYYHVAWGYAQIIESE